MKIIYRLLYLQLFKVTTIAIAVVTTLFVLLNVLKDVIALLMNSVVPALTIAQMVLLLVPFVLMFTIPWGFLIAVLLVFGRLSQDREILALKSSGISLVVLAAPTIILALAACLLLLYINTTLSPAARFAFKQIVAEVLRKDPTALFVPGKSIEQFPGYRIYIREKNGPHLTDIHLWTIDTEGNPIRSLRADHGRLELDQKNERIIIHLHNSRQEERRRGDSADTAYVVPGVSAEYIPLTLSLEGLFKKAERKLSPSNMTISQLRRHLASHASSLDPSSIAAILTEANKRLALAFAPLTFTLIAIPLAIQTRRKETSTGVALSLAIVLTYFFMLVLAEAFKRNIALHPEMLVWLPNIIFQALGVFLLIRVNRL
ncbi:MAG: LptF/LptG family permease [Methylacidiphilales bacterium]|nr:LptF/LptG family permease [Candidatus Methylacidiphilales bacterium]MDW8348893.1 LptF/LptG family permease [Verrucomicrobiae bacterium]